MSVWLLIMAAGLAATIYAACDVRRDRARRIAELRKQAERLRAMGWDTVEPGEIDRPDHPVLLDTPWNRSVTHLRFDLGLWVDADAVERSLKA